MKKENGITLIALVITIIVLLILAGISIAMLTGDNGIINKANVAAVRTQEAEAEESLKLAVMAVLADKLDPQSSVTEIDAEGIIAANINSNVTLVANTANDVEATEDEPKLIGIDATIGKTTYSYTVNSETGKVAKK